MPRDGNERVKKVENHNDNNSRKVQSRLNQKDGMCILISTKNKEIGSKIEGERKQYMERK